MKRWGARRIVRGSAVALAVLFVLGFARDDTEPGCSSERAEALPRSAPARIEISDVGINAAVMEVGDRFDGGVGAPPLGRAQRAGWYRPGPSPGEAGQAVIVGHLDSRTGPAVFYRLGQVREGDQIKITRRDGSVAVFEAESRERLPKKKFPGEKRREDSQSPVLQLVTCAGKFDERTHTYAENLVVSARLVRSSVKPE